MPEVIYQHLHLRIRHIDSRIMALRGYAQDRRVGMPISALVFSNWAYTLMVSVYVFLSVMGASVFLSVVGGGPGACVNLRSVKLHRSHLQKEDSKPTISKLCQH